MYQREILEFLDDCCEFYSGLNAGDMLINHFIYDFTFQEVRDQIRMQTKLGSRLYEKIELLYEAKKAADARARQYR